MRKQIGGARKFAEPRMKHMSEVFEARYLLEHAFDSVRPKEDERRQYIRIRLAYAIGASYRLAPKFPMLVALIDELLSDYADVLPGPEIWECLYRAKILIEQNIAAFDTKQGNIEIGE